MVIVLTKTLDTYIIVHVRRGALPQNTPNVTFFQIYAFIWSKQNLIGARHFNIPQKVKIYMIIDYRGQKSVLTREFSFL